MSDAQLIGRLTAVVCFAALALFFLVRGLMATQTSRRLANLALCCGLTSFCSVEFALGWTPAQHPDLFNTLAVVRLALGLLGVVFTVLALVRRRQDQGTGVFRPLLGGSLSLLHIAVGAFYFVLTSSPFLDAAGDQATAWVHTEPEHGLRLTFPSDRWKRTNARSGVGFFHQSPRMQVGIFAVYPRQSEADFRTGATRLLARMESDPTLKASLKRRDGENAKGHRFVYFQGVERGERGQEVFVASSLTWIAEKELMAHLIFEGIPTMQSRTGRASELAAFEKAAEAILSSLE
jgi:hypothetical protein